MIIAGNGYIWIHAIDYGIDDKVVFSYGGGKKTRAKIRYDDNGAYFISHGMKEYLGEMIRYDVQ